MKDEEIRQIVSAAVSDATQNLHRRVEQLEVSNMRRDADNTARSNFHRINQRLDRVFNQLFPSCRTCGQELRRLSPAAGIDDLGTTIQDKYPPGQEAEPIKAYTDFRGTEALR